MRMLLLGKNGQLGRALQVALAPLGELIAVDVDSVDYCGDLRSPADIVATVQQLQPDVIVNAAAYTAVDQAEIDMALAEQINATSVAALAQAAQAVNAWLVHYSTDYVFDGSGTEPWQECDRGAPLNHYGRTKLAGDEAVQRYCSRHLIFRTSWLYARHGHNFATTMLRLGQQQSAMTVVADQYGAPTSAQLVAECTAHALGIAQQRPAVAGLYHLAAQGCTSWFAYANYVLMTAKARGMALTVNTVTPIPSSAFARPACRPHNSRLNSTKFERTFALALPAWQCGVAQLLAELIDEPPQ